jgi:two-component system, sensor histidine kinase and response regulator
MLAYARHGLALVAAAFIAAALYTGSLIRERESRLVESSRASLQWTASQSVSELLRLETAIAKAGLQSGTLGEVKLRYDIFANRVTTLTGGEFQTFASTVPAVDEAVRASQQVVDTLRPLISRVDHPDTAAQALVTLQPVGRKLIIMATTAFRHTSEAVSNDQAVVFRLHWQLLLLIVGLAVCSLLLVAYQYLNQRLLVKAHQTMKRTAAELKEANAKAVAASEAKSMFLANMSHEIRTPMNGVFGMTDLLRRSPLNAHQRRLVDTINQSSKTLLGIINDILDISRVEAGQMTLDAQPFEPERCIEQAAELFAEEAAQKGLDLSVRIDRSVPMMVRGDSGRVRQICINLIGNAIKFTERGHVAITVTSKALDGPRHALEIRVTDSGIGMSEAALREVHKPFTQADASITRRFGGTGLGLSIARQLVALMGGSLTITSQVGSGTTVTATPVFDVIETVADDRSLRDVKVLLLATTPDGAVEIATGYLRAAGATVQSAAFSDIPAAALADGDFDIVLLDVVATTAHDQIAAVVRARGIRAETPIVTLAPAAWHPDEALIDAETFAQLTKPLARTLLIDTVKTAVGARALSKAVSPRDGLVPASNMNSAVLVRPRALVAEDNPVNQEIAREFLWLAGLEVTVVDNGALAVAAFQTAAFDVIFMDCQMPVMDGFTATARIRDLERRSGGRRAPIIALTANAYASDRERCLTSGMDDHLAKPFTELQLRGIIDRYVPTADAAPRPAYAA